MSDTSPYNIAKPSTVIFIHGLGRHSFDMAPFAWRCRREFPTWKVINFGYPSRQASIEENGRRLKDLIIREVPPGTRLHFVGHSLGSIITRITAPQLTEQYELGRAVFLGPPNQGSSLAKALGRYSVFRFILGPALNELAHLSVPLSTDLLEVGIIAGGTGGKFGYLPLLGGDNDGIVLVEETELLGAKEHSVTGAPHAVLMFAPGVMQKTFRFLETGKFDPT